MSDDLFSKALENSELEVELPALDQDEIKNINVDKLEAQKLDKNDKDEEDVENVDDSSSSSDESDSSSNSSPESDSDGKEDEADDLEDDIEEEVIDGPIKSKNELAEEEAMRIPENYTISDTTILKEVGKVKSIYQNNIIIENNATGENRVLKEGSIFCLTNEKKIIGRLTEVFGKLTAPFYRILLPKEEDMDEWKLKIGENVSIIVNDSSWVDTFMLRKFKGTDASNAFDEELPESEQEFSDDEKEMNHKKMKKQQRKSNKCSTFTNNKVQKPNNTQQNHDSKVKYPTTKFPKSSHFQRHETTNNCSSSSYRSRNSRTQSHPDTIQTNNYTPPPVPQFQPPTHYNAPYPNMNVGMDQNYQQLQYPGNFQQQYPQQPYLPVQANMYQNQQYNNYNNHNMPNPIQGSNQQMNQILQLHSLLLQQQNQQQEQQQQQQQQQNGSYFGQHFSQNNGSNFGQDFQQQPSKPPHDY